MMGCGVYFNSVNTPAEKVSNWTIRGQCVNFVLNPATISNPKSSMCIFDNRTVPMQHV